MQEKQDRFVRIPETIFLTAKSRATIYRDMAAGTFPQAVKIGQRAIGWRLSDLEKWMADQSKSAMS